MNYWKKRRRRRWKNHVRLKLSVIMLLFQHFWWTKRDHFTVTIVNWTYVKLNKYCISYCTSYCMCMKWIMHFEMFINTSWCVCNDSTEIQQSLSHNTGLRRVLANLFCELIGQLIIFCTIHPWPVYYMLCTKTIYL